MLEELRGGQARLAQLRAHAAADVEDQADGDRLVVHREVRDGLLDAVVEDFEMLLLQSGDRAVRGVADGDRHQHQVGVDAQVRARPGFSGAARQFRSRLSGHLSVGDAERAVQRGRTGLGPSAASP